MTKEKLLEKIAEAVIRYECDNDEVIGVSLSLMATNVLEVQEFTFDGEKFVKVN
jgi:hypothetical protein